MTAHPQVSESPPRRFSVLISGASPDHCGRVHAMLADQPGLDVSMQIHDQVSAPTRPSVLHADVLIAVLGSRGDEELQALAAIRERPPTIAVGPANDVQLLRRAMQAGVRDYLAAPVPPRELIEAVQRIAHEQTSAAAQAPAAQCRLIAVINVKGGSGASFIASSLAHIAAVRGGKEVGLLDFDLQFGALPLAFDLEQRSTLLAALTSASQLDPTALRGYMARHDSGVSVLSAMSEQLVLPWEVPPQSLKQLLQVMRQSFAAVVVDLPRQIDPLSTAVIEQADCVVLVMQQSLAHVRDAKRMRRVLTGALGIPRERLLLVVNRHSEKHSVRARDIQDAVNPESMMFLPNDFVAVTDALNMGVPVYESRRDAIVTRALESLTNRVGLTTAEAAPARKRGLREVLAQSLRA